MGRAAVGCLVAPFALIALIIMGLGFVFLADSVSRSNSGIETEGVIVDLIESTDSDGDTMYRPVVEYSVDGVTYEVESRTSSGGALRPRIGDARTVLYDPQNPGDAVLGGFWSLWGAPLLMMLIPLLFIGGGVWAVTRVRRKSQSEGPGEVSGPNGPGDRHSIDDGQADVAYVPEGFDDNAARRIEALFMGVEPSPMDADGTIRYRIRARGEVDGESRRFLSGWLDEDPTLLLMQAGNRVEVLFDPADPGRYRVVLPADAV
ncbi:MAG TPA: DUF3592 domain-containing protein [Acidimicrobiia bacterium]|nr:DUF3592 domain-containing protein [Acidimicrobiia bacterium]